MDWVKLLESLLYVVFTVCVPLVIKAMYPYLKAKSQEAATKVESETAQKYLGYALDAVVDSVTFTFQTYVDSLKAAGEFNAETGKEAFNKAKTRALELMTDEVKNFIKMTYGDLDIWLETKIEAEVKTQKSGVLVGTELEVIE